MFVRSLASTVSRAGAPPTGAGALPGDLVLAEPEVAGPLAVYPLLAPPGEFEYWAFAEAATRGFKLTELREAQVNDLRAHNPLDVAVLLSDFEIVTGAQQDRVADVPVLVGPGMTHELPVSCVEEGRWDECRHGEAFRGSSYALAPSLRARRSARVREALAEGLPPRADQEETWAEVAELHEDAGIEPRTGALRDVYAGQHDRLAELEASFSRRPGQVGAVVCVEGRPVVLDYVSRSEVWAALWRGLLRGYCLDALAAEGSAIAAPAATAGEVLAAADDVTPERHPTIGLGNLLTFDGADVAGTGLMLGRELIQLSAFPPEA